MMVLWGVAVAWVRRVAVVVLCDGDGEDGDDGDADDVVYMAYDGDDGGGDDYGGSSDDDDAGVDHDDFGPDV